MAIKVRDPYSPKEGLERQLMEATLLYDGECPFCSRYARYARLKDTIKLRLVNAREGGREVEEATRRGYSLDEGMLLMLGNRHYHAEHCLNILALLSSGSGMFNRLTAALFQSPRIASLAYPILVSGRNLALRLKRQDKLGY